MARLCCGVNDEVRLERQETGQYFGAMTYVELVMLKAGMKLEETTLVPSRVASRTKEICPHVVVHPMNFPAETTEEIDYFGTNQSGRTRDEQLAHK